MESTGLEGFVIKDAVDRELAAGPTDALSRITLAPKSKTDFLEWISPADRQVPGRGPVLYRPAALG
jgi:hypothetical protein